jgi:prepilin-type N-terminal cleavage/methylation domain-containing protein
MYIKNRSTSGFTIVELLIVIVVIGILAALVLNTFSSAQEKAKAASAQNDMKILKEAILAARENTGGKTLMNITGSNCTYCGVIPYATALDRIATASGANLDALKKGDPWGNVYRIDENEGEQSGNPCVKDSVTVSGHPGLGFHVPFIRAECI